MDIRRTDPHHPNLSIGNALAQLVTRLQLIGIDDELSRFNVNGGKLVFVGRLELRPNFFLVDAVATPGELLFAVAAFGASHGLTPGGLWRTSGQAFIMVFA